MPNANYFKIGLFTFAGLLVFLAGVFFIGLSGSLFKETVSCVTFFNRSVQGLSVDSNVKFRGFNVGKITDITLAEVENRSGQPVVKVTFDIDPKALGSKGEDLDSASEYIIEQTNSGLKAFLSFQGITGLGYLDLDYNSQVKSDLDESLVQMAKRPDQIFIPNGPGQIMEISESATAIVKSLSEVDFAGLSRDIKDLVKSVESSVDKFNKGWLSADISDTLTEISQAAASINQLAQNVDSSFAKGSDSAIGQKIEASLTQLRNTLKRFDQLLGSSQSNLPMTLDNLRVMSENLRELSELLKDQPSQAIFGQPPKQSRPNTSKAIEK